MECNCNNNNSNSNGGVIPWVRGNRLPLIICVYENVVTQEQVGDSTLTVNEMTRVPYTIQDNDTVTVIMKSGFRQVEMPFTTDGNKVMVTDNGELPTGAYTVEVTIERGDGARGRWQETRQVRIYENTSDAQLGEMYSIDADLFFYAKGDTGTGIADITNNPDGTLTITMTDGTSYVTEALKGDKGDKGDTGERGVSIVAFDVTGQTDVSVIYTVTFSDDTTQDISVPKGPQGDTGLTGNGISSTALNSDYTLTIAYTDGTTYTTPSIRGAQGAQGVSVIGFTQTGETPTNTMYNLVFSDGRTQSVAIPKGVKGDKGDTGNPGPQGAQGPKGDTVIIGDEQTYTLYDVTGNNTDGAMTQKAVTDNLPHNISTTWVSGGIKATDGSNTTTDYRIRTDYIDVKGGEIIKVNAKTHYVGIYLYNQDKSSALGEYAHLLTTGKYEYTCPQAGWVRFIESKNTGSTVITTSEQISEILFVPDTVYALKSELEERLSSKLDCDTVANSVDFDRLYTGIGYPDVANNIWYTNKLSNTYRYHKVIKRTPEMKIIKVDASSEHAARYMFATDYAAPQEGDVNVPLFFCNGCEEVYNISSQGTSGWIDIPDDCEYIIVIEQNGTSNQYLPKSVYVYDDTTDYNTTDMIKLSSSVFVQGGISAEDGSNTNPTTRLRTPSYFKLKKGGKIIIDCQQQVVNIYLYSQPKSGNDSFVRATGWYYDGEYVATEDCYVRFTVASKSRGATMTPSVLYANVYMTDINTEGDSDKDEYTDKVAAVKWPPRENQTVKGNILSLLHFSDLHITSSFEIQRIINFKEKYSNYIDDILNTGDLQDQDFSSGIAAFTEVDGHEYILNVIGNHDAYKANSWNYDNNNVNVYNRFVGPFVENWNVSQPDDAETNGLNYWYKDYGTQGIRLIAIDCMYWTSAQKTWLEGVLADALSNELSVVCASHYRPCKSTLNGAERWTDIPCNMNDLTLQPYVPGGVDFNLNSNALSAVQDFIDNNGKFICWLSGHEHKDYVGYGVSYPDQLFIGVATAQCGARMNSGVMERIEGTRNQDLFNIVGFDTYNKQVRVLRVGADFDCYMRSKKSFCINYETHNIIAQS